MALLYLEEDPWIIEHESCEKLQREVMGQLAERENFPRTSTKYAQISADIRLRLKQFNNEVMQLKQKLDAISGTSSITLAESERRARQIEVLMTKATQMQKLFDDQLSKKRMAERSDLIGGVSGADWDTIETSEMTVDEIQSRQRQMLGDQEQGLENLAKIISRQKDIANTISNEMDYHNEILNDIGTQIDQTDQRVRTETGRVSTVSQKDSTCGYWIVIIILFISIIIVAAI
ncbi:syntaxin-8 [Euwallacea fornicatus]|uniref:syntaxin-8 n=1 Tax=Euwallacea fornicatus TaxID=995702 RepID=UPI00338F1590